MLEIKINVLLKFKYRSYKSVQRTQKLSNHHFYNEIFFIYLKNINWFSLNNLMLEMTHFFSFVTIPILHIFKSILSFFSGPSLEFLSPVQRSMSQINLIFSYFSDYEAGHSFSIILFISCYTQCHGDFLFRVEMLLLNIQVFPEISFYLS